MNENTEITEEPTELHPMRGIVITPRLRDRAPDLIEVHTKDTDEATDAWIRRAVGCDMFDLVTFRTNLGAFDMWVDDEGLYRDCVPNMMASLLIADPETGRGAMIVGKVLIVPSQMDGETRGFSADDATLDTMVEELSNVATALYQVWTNSPEGMIGAMLLDMADGLDADNAAGNASDAVAGLG